MVSEMSYSAEEMAKILFPKGLPGTNGWKDAEAHLTPEQLEVIRKEAKRMEDNLNSMPTSINVGGSNIAEKVKKLKEEYGPGVGIMTKTNADGGTEDTPFVYKKFPASEVPDEATKAFMRELNGESKVYRQSAHGFLEEASETMKRRAALRDAEDGERTAAQIAHVFNAITGNDLSEADAWMFLIVLKIVRSRNGKFNRDDFVDMAAYAGLLGECESVSRKA